MHTYYMTSLLPEPPHASLQTPTLYSINRRPGAFITNIFILHRPIQPLPDVPQTPPPTHVPDSHALFVLSTPVRASGLGSPLVKRFLRPYGGGGPSADFELLPAADTSPPSAHRGHPSETHHLRQLS